MGEIGNYRQVHPLYHFLVGYTTAYSLCFFHRAFQTYYSPVWQRNVHDQHFTLTTLRILLEFCGDMLVWE